MTRLKPRVLVTGVYTNYGGVETVVSRFIGKLSDDFAFDSVTSLPFKQDQYYQGDNRIINLPKRRDGPLRYELALRSFFASESVNYQALWHNVSSFSNIDPLKYASQYDVPVRICHSHVVKPNGCFVNKALHKLHSRKAPSLSTLNLACSPEAGIFAFGDRPFGVLPNAFDVNEFAYDRDSREEIRSELGLCGKFVIGLVGRLAPEKNSLFVINLMPEIINRRSNAVLLLIGEGRSRRELEQRVTDLNLTDSVIMPGARADISRVLSALDVFAFPSLHEGLGLAAVEAQANGLPVVMSDNVPELAVVSKSVQRISLGDPDAWIESLLAASREKFISDRELIMRYDIDQAANRLAEYLMGGVPPVCRDSEMQGRDCASSNILHN